MDFGLLLAGLVALAFHWRLSGFFGRFQNPAGSPLFLLTSRAKSIQQDGGCLNDWLRLITRYCGTHRRSLGAGLKTGLS